MRTNSNQNWVIQKADKLKHGKLLIGLAFGFMLGGIGSAAVFAAIPGSDGAIHACYRTSNGSLRIIDDASETCTSSETAISWAQSSEPEPGDMVQNLVGANFRRSDLAYRDFSGADLRNVIFDVAILRGSDLHGANLEGASFQSTELDRVDLHGTDLSGLTFFQVSMSGINLSGADLSNATIAGAYLADANLQGANFSAAQLSDIQFFGGTADISNTNFTNAQLTNSNFTGIDMSTVTITGATWSNVTCPDGSNSDSNGNTCAGHLAP